MNRLVYITLIGQDALCVETEFPARTPKTARISELGAGQISCVWFSVRLILVFTGMWMIFLHFHLIMYDIVDILKYCVIIFYTYCFMNNCCIF